MNRINKYKPPILFYTLSTLIPWSLWGIAAYLSHSETTFSHNLYGFFCLLGLCAPVVVGFSMMMKEEDLKKDLYERLFTFRRLKARYIFATLCLMPASILIAQGISLLFGHSMGQFTLAESVSFTFGLFPAWIILFLAPLLEELAWHSYGTDCLRAKFSLLTTSLIFSLFWVVWHIPLGFIKGYYHNNLAESGLLYSLNFAFSLFPFVILMNWLYYKSNRNILVAVFFHISAGVFNEMFQTHPDSKVIQTGLLTVLCLYLLWKEPTFFFSAAFAQNENMGKNQTSAA